MNELVDAGTIVATCASLPETCGANGIASCCTTRSVPGGTFLRAGDVGADGRYNNPSFPATIGFFHLDKYEVTVGRFRQFVDAQQGTQQHPPEPNAGAHAQIPGSGWDASWNAYLPATTDDLRALLACDALATWTDAPGPNESRPINCLPWYQAMAFCAWDGGFLPTFAEWEFAALGGSEQRAYPWSNPPSSTSITPAHASYFVDATKQCFGDLMNGCTLTDIVPVGSKPAGDGVFGHSDLGGNIFEWVLDSNAPLANPCHDCANLIETGYRRIVGGAFDTEATLARGADTMYSVTPEYGGPNNGVRCARL